MRNARYDLRNLNVSGDLLVYCFLHWLIDWLCYHCGCWASCGGARLRRQTVTTSVTLMLLRHFEMAERPCENPKESHEMGARIPGENLQEGHEMAQSPDENLQGSHKKAQSPGENLQGTCHQCENRSPWTVSQKLLAVT